MKKKYTPASVALCIGLFSFNTFSSCVNTREALGINPMRKLDCSGKSAKALGLATILTAGVGGIYYVANRPSESNAGLNKNNSSAISTTSEPSIFNTTILPTSNKTSENNSMIATETLDGFNETLTSTLNNPLFDDSSPTDKLSSEVFNATELNSSTFMDTSDQSSSMQEDEMMMS